MLHRAEAGTPLGIEGAALDARVLDCLRVGEAALHDSLPCPARCAYEPCDPCLGSLIWLCGGFLGLARFAWWGGGWLFSLKKYVMSTSCPASSPYSGMTNAGTYAALARCSGRPNPTAYCSVFSIPRHEDRLAVLDHLTGVTMRPPSRITTYAASPHPRQLSRINALEERR